MGPLRDLFRHHAWATTTLIDYCATLPPEQLHASAPGTYGPVLATLVHLVAADQRYLELLTGEIGDDRIREGDEPTLAALRARFEAQQDRWSAVLDRLDEVDVTLPARGRFPEMPHATNLLLLQALHHGNDHRTHVCTVLGTLGLSAPDIDGWAYWLVNRT